MKLLKLIVPLCIAAVSMVQCTNPQTTQTRPTYYVKDSSPASVAPNHQALASAQISGAVTTSVDNSTLSFNSENRAKSSNVQKSSETNVHYYTNVNGNRVQAPTYYDSAPAGACAQCEDGTYSFSRNRRGTCSRHGGVKVWLR